MPLWIIATVCAFFIKGLCGFANTLVFTSILSFKISNSKISPVELLLGYPSNMILTWKERKSIDPTICIPLSVLVLLGSVLGVLFLKNVDARFIKVLFGIAVILIALEMILRETDLIKLFTKRKTFSERTSNREDLSSKENAIEKTDRKIYRTPAFWIVGLLSGFLCGLYGVGALLGAYLGRVTKDMSSFKGNISLIFLVENTFRIILYGMSGLLNMASIKMALLLVPVAILSLTLGMLAGKKMGDRAVRKTVMILLILSGILLICKNIG